MLRQQRLRQKSGIPMYGLQALYRFNEGSGQVAYDSSLSGADMQLGSVVGADTNDPSWIAVTGGLLLSTDDALRQSKLVSAKVGTVTASMVATVAFINDSGQDFVPYVRSGGVSRNVLVAFDGTYYAMGYIGEQGTGETLGDEKLLNPSLETLGGGGADVFANWGESFNNGTIEAAIDSVQNGAYSAKMTVGASGRPDLSQVVASSGGELYKLVFWCRGDNTNAVSYALYGLDTTTFCKSYTSTANTSTIYVQKNYYITNLSNETRPRLQFAENSTPGTYVYIDNVSVKQVLTPSTSGVKIYSTKTGSVQSWTRIETGFNPNAAGIQYEIRRVLG